MSSFTHGFTAELRLLVSERRYRLMVVLFLGAALLCAETYHERVVRELPVAVIDLDESRLSRLARLWLEATPELTTAAVTPGSIDEARADLVAGRLAGVIIIPSRFSARIKAGESGEVVVAADMSNVLVGRTVQRAVARVLGTLGAGVTMTTLQKLGEPSHDALAHAAPVALAEGFPFNPEASYAVYLAPAYVYFFLHVFALFIAWSVLAPVSGAAPVGRARLGAFAAVLAVTTALGLALTYGLLRREGITPASSPLVVTAALVAFLALDLLLAAALASAVPSPLLAFQVTVLLGMLSFVLSGLTWPADTFPAALRALSGIIPFTPFGRAFRAFLHEPTSFAELAPAWLAMAAQAALWTTVLAAGRLARRVVPAWRHA